MPADNAVGNLTSVEDVFVGAIGRGHLVHQGPHLASLVEIGDFDILAADFLEEPCTQPNAGGFLLSTTATMWIRNS